ncbi:MAG: hypothetical protein JO306_02045, partial [Gemmatimonadetes bacterium]|nr:hypothetical protein [Gemmatimonadota bacterium]
CTQDSVRAEQIGKGYPDGTVFRPGQIFLQTWTIINRASATCGWNSQYVLRFLSAPRGRLSSPARSGVLVEELVIPGQSFTFEVPMRAPTKEGWYSEEWIFTDPNGRAVTLEKGTRADTRIIVSQNAAQTPHGRLCGDHDIKVGWWGAETIRDGTPLIVGTSFVKKFTLPNTGDCVWNTGLRLHFVSTAGGPPLSLSQRDIPITREVPPGATYTFVIPMRATLPIGRREERWALVDHNGKRIPISGTLSVWVRAEITLANP